MNTALGQKDRPWRAMVTLKNGESSTGIVAGQPVCLAMNGTDDGFAVVLPSTATAAKAYSLFKGIAVPIYNTTSSAPYTADVGTYFKTIIGGYCQTTRLVKATRAASTSAWPSFAAGAIGDVLVVDTTANALANLGTAVQSNLNGPGVLLETYASATTVASNAYTSIVAASATALTVNVKSNIRQFA